MAKNFDQLEPALPAGDSEQRDTSNHLPRYFRTEFNNKFLNATLDQMVSPGKVERLNAYYGKRTAKAFTPTDNYVGDVTANRENYQFEPVSVIKDSTGNVEFFADYNDYINTLDIRRGSTDNHSKLNAQEYYAWDPQIDFDKFINFRNYYWLPSGPDPVTVVGNIKDITSTMTVNLKEEDENILYQWTPDGLTGNRTLTLYRGQTYRFEIDTPSYALAIATRISFVPGKAILIEAFEGVKRPGIYDYLYYDMTDTEYDAGGWIIPPREASFTEEEQENASLLYRLGMKFFNENGVENNNIVWMEKGVIEWTIPETAPDVLYYVSKDNANTAGVIKIEDVIEATEINVEEEIIGKKTYTSESEVLIEGALSPGVSLTNGMKINFAGNVFPQMYGTGDFYVEGVGSKIQLVPATSLDLSTSFVSDFSIEFDNQEFDYYPYSEAFGWPDHKDYMVVNRSSLDGNLWSRHNRWFHIDVIEKSLQINGQIPSVDIDARAKRPIIEFKPNLKLFNFGVQNKKNVNLVDTVTKDVFSTIEGSVGYNIDNVEISNGMRILFTADTDVRVQGRIFEVKFITFKNSYQITLQDVDDTEPLDNESVLVLQGDKYKGKFFHYTNGAWKLSQDKTGVNQPPLFDLYDYNDVPFTDSVIYNNSQFVGNKIFSYKVGDGANDNVLGFPISYQNIQNSGDILFDFNLINDVFLYTRDNETFTQQDTKTSFLRQYVSRTDYKNLNGYQRVESESQQMVIRQYIADGTKQEFAIDVYDNLDFINDLWIRVYRNNEILEDGVSYEVVQDVNGYHYVKFIDRVVNHNDNIIIKTKSKYSKNNNGYYEIPYNLERNPSNETLSEFTLGEVTDHVHTIVEEINGFNGIFPGISNLRDLGDVTKHGKKFLKHSAPFNLCAYHLLNNNANVIDAIEYARIEYAKFKREFVETSTNLGYDGPIKQHVDKILNELIVNKTESLPFYFSDMVPFNGQLTNSEEIFDEDQEFFALSQTFDINTPSLRAVQVYLNGIQLVWGKDYEFNDQGFVRVYAKKKSRDIVEIYEYESTVGSYIPATPTKLGLYPAYEPKIYIDDTTIRPYYNKEDVTPYTVYGQGDADTAGEGQIGWFYPVFTDRNAAIDEDIKLGGDGNITFIKLVGCSTPFFMPNADINVAAQLNTLYLEYNAGAVTIQGHDGSRMAAYKDYRDQLLLEYEKRIYNNIKVKYDPKEFDIHDYLDGYYRKVAISKEVADKASISDFLAWSKLINREWTAHMYLNIDNPFTYNYNKTRLPNGELAPGWWREIYRYVYDTDRPHTHPWEMLGFTVKPTYWEDEYGKGPYTANNLIMWRDISDGIIRGPQFHVNKKYVRPNLLRNIPVDDLGNLKNPSEANVVSIANYNYVNNSFEFGDGSPVESAWKQSSEYPFSVLKAITLSQPSKVFAIIFDRIRQKRNIAGQLVYNATYNHITLKDIIYPLHVGNNEGHAITSGLINYITDYRAILAQERYSDYKNDLQRITNQLAFKVGGYTDKSKFKLILDARSPLNEGNIFIPDENYQITLGTSYPLTEHTYSGVIVEKQPEGFYVKGYDLRNPVFNYYKGIERSADRQITVGAVSVNYVVWGERKTYAENVIVAFDNNFYRCKVTHRATAEFDLEKFTKLPELPSVGGATAKVRKTWERTLSTMPYGSLLPTIQDVVDFLLGYEKYLEELGFVFTQYVDDAVEIANWLYAAKQFMFWSTQGWDTGALITLSPLAERLEYNNNFAAVANVFDTSSGYSVLRADGTPLKAKYLKLFRDKVNNFSIRTSNTPSGIYAIRLPIVLKEHIILIDNKTVFNDIIYDPTSGYRQERIKVIGYRVDGWNGSLSIPGFVFDEARVSEWREWKDYEIGDIVKYKEYYYSANFKVPGSSVFIDSYWTRLDDKPESKLYANFDYRADQFRDFYDLDSDNFDAEQQRMAQHLIGYQKRNYLQNIINNEVSQYKFYQGFIQEKGTRNAFTKLFDVLSSTGQESLEFFEEWGIKNSQYGAVDGFDEVEYVLDEQEFRLVPQPVLLTDNATGKETDLIYRIRSSETYLKSKNYNHKPFPSKYVIDTYTKNAGYVNSNDVDFVLGEYKDLLDISLDEIHNGQYVWIGNYKKDWNVFQYQLYDNQIIELDKIEGDLTHFLIRTNYIPDLEIGDIIGIFNVQEITYAPHEDSALKTEIRNSYVNGFFEITDITLNEIILETDPTTAGLISSENLSPVTGLISRFVSTRVPTVPALVDLAKTGLNIGEKVWIDDIGDKKWCVLEKSGSISDSLVISRQGQNFVNYGQSISVNHSNNILIVGAPDEEHGKVYVYSRPNVNRNWQLAEEIEPDISLTTLSSTSWTVGETYAVDDIVLYRNNDYTCVVAHTAGSAFEPANFTLSTIYQRFGASVDVSTDGKYLIVGAPNASYVRSKLIGDFNEEELYDQFDIVKYNGIFWEALVNVRRANEIVQFKSFYNLNQSLVDLDLDDDDDPGLNLLLAGNFPLNNLLDNDHFLLRVPTDAYKGISPGDRIRLKWNSITNANQTQMTLTPREPFNGDIPYLSSSYITDTEHIVNLKVDVIVEVENVLATPPVGSQVSTTNAVGRIAYVFNNAGRAVIYINEVIGDFPTRDTLETPDTVIGEFVLSAPISYDRPNVEAAFGGYVMINTNAVYNTGDNVLETGQGLVITDIMTDTTPSDVFFYNVLDHSTTVSYGDNTEHSLIHSFSQAGTRLINAGMYEDDEIILPYYGVRAPKELTDVLVSGDQISMYFNKIKKTVAVLKVRNTRFSFPPEVKAGEILTQANTGAYCTVFSDVVEVAAETTDPTNPVYNIFVQLLSEPAIMFNQLDNLSGSLSGDLFVRPVAAPVVNQLVTLDTIGISDNDFIQDDNTISVWNLWDGYIDYEEDYYSSQGLPYIPVSKFVDNGLGDLVDTGITPHVVRQIGTNITADVMYVQRLSNRTVRVYVDNVQGQWTVGSNHGAQDEIEFLAYPGQVDIYGRANIYTIDRPIGTINRTSLGYASEGIGKFLILRNTSNIPIVIDEDTETQVKELYNTEYWMFLNRDRSGVVTISNIPSQSSTVWKQVYNVGATAIGYSSPYIYEGLTYIYQLFSNNYVQDKVILSPQRDNSAYFGANVKIKRTASEFYKGYVLAQAGQENIDHPGKIYFLRQGQDGSEYYNWDYSKDKNFKGIYNENETYFGGDVIYRDTRLLSARTNMLPGPFDSQYWREMDNLIDYVGYVPNDLSYTALVGDDTSSRLDLQKLYDFGTVYDVSDDGEVLAAFVRYLEKPNNVVIYRNFNGQYIYSQLIESDSIHSGFGESISLNEDGSVLVIGDPYDDTKDHDAGKVFIYKLQNQQFELDQEILSPADDALEMFGINVDIDKNHIAIGAKNADVEMPTIIDGGTTTFDNSFTGFAYEKQNTGLIYMYEKINGSYAYGDYLSSVTESNRPTYDFGSAFTFRNNGIYIGLPKFGSNGNVGTIVNYKKTGNFYTALREPKITVDVDKIKRVMLYNKKTKQTVKHLDYVDPLQNKFPGLAEENIKYKLYYDPAFYTTGTDEIAVIDPTIAWGEKQVGELWWKLTNARYYYPYQDDITFSTNVWSKTFESNSIDVYEWVESDVLPADWDAVADTLEGLAQGISGISLYGNTAYVEKQSYDDLYDIFTTKYYFWVKGKRILPNIEGRTLHAGDVEDLLQDPATFGYEYVGLISNDSFAVYNCKQYLEDDNVVISFHFYTIDDQRINVHNEYQLMTENLSTSVPKIDIERKWVDSLVGYDQFGRSVPDLSLSEKYRYGMLNEPRQSWFVNRVEALKVYIERINYVLKSNLIVDSKNLSRLLERDNYDSSIKNVYDISITSNSELKNYGTTRIQQAEATLEIVDGSIATIFVTNPGKGYVTPPTFVIPGQGEGAEISFTLNSIGSIASAVVVDGGRNYKSNAIIQIRPFTALVTNDETLQGKWAYYQRDTRANSWTLAKIQGYDTTNYWDYVDWYTDGYDEFTKVQFIIDYSYELADIESNIGDIVKINNIGSGGWLLLKQVNDILNADYTVNFETIGRQNGTIQFKNTLYDAFAGDINFDLVNFDTGFYDPLPSSEIRFIHQAIKEDIFIEELAVEYNRLFFAMLRYILSEQTYVDWFFKTSFVRAKHNVGELRKDITFNNDFLPFYQDYIAEVKSFKSKIREYISAYEKIDNTNSRITDFDLSPIYDPQIQRIVPFEVKAYSTTLLGTQQVDTYPQKNWFDNCRYEIKAVHIIDGGVGYQSPPKIYLVGGGGHGAELKTHLGINGTIREIEIINVGKHYLSIPGIEINGSLNEDGRHARLAVEIGNSVVRTMTTTMKFDRVSSKYEIEDLLVEERIVSSGSQTVFKTEWPLDLAATKTTVTVDGITVLSSEISWQNILDTSKGYDRYTGEITLAEAPAKYSEIIITYHKDVDLLLAHDRINLLYDPEIGQLGKDLGQLMDGIDYGGVEVRSFDFGSLIGWDTGDWYTTSYDSYDLSFDDRTMRVPTHLKEYTALGYKVQINWTAIAKTVNAIAKGDSANINLSFAQMFTFDNAGNQIVDPNDPSIILYADPSSILNVAGSNNQISFESADKFQKYRLGILDDVVALNNIENEVVPRFNDLTQAELEELIDAGILLELYFTTDDVIEVGVEYNVYHNGIRIDDPNYGTVDPVTNPNAKIQTIIGTGETISILLRDLGLDIETDDTFTLRRPSSDGSFLPSDTDYDTQIVGGQLDYGNAQGISAAEIVIDGDNFVTPLTSKGPEEVVPGQIMDTVDIQVYNRPSPGVSTITCRNFTTDGKTNKFPIGTVPLTEYSLLVKIDGKIKKINKDYVINAQDQTIELAATPRAKRKLNLTCLDYSGTNVLDVDTIIANGVDDEYSVNVKWQDDLVAQVSIDSYVTEFVLTQDTRDKTTKITLPLIPAKGAIIRYAIFKGDQLPYSTITVDEFTVTGLEDNFVLSTVPVLQSPEEWHTLVFVNDQLLNPGYTQRFILTEAREYQLKLWQVPLSSVGVEELRIFLNGYELQKDKDFVYASLGETNPLLKSSQQNGSTIQLQRGVGNPGDELKVYVTGLEENTAPGGDYRYGYFDDGGVFVKTPGVLYLYKDIIAGDNVRVYQFSNHDTQGIDWQSFDINERTKLSQGTIDERAVLVITDTNAVFNLSFELEYQQLYSITVNDIRVDDINFGSNVPVTNPFAKTKTYVGDGSNVLRLSDIGNFFVENDYVVIEKVGATITLDQGSVDWYDYRQLQNGIIKLNSPAIEDQYVWVAVNGTMLHSSVDYHITNNKRYIRLAKHLSQNDVIQIIHFSENTSQQRLGYRIFKDILNRTSYSIVDGSQNVVLEEDLNWYDKYITVKNPELLPDPGQNAKKPAVIFINKERIEYYQIVQNRIQQIRRGTLGTGVPNVHLAGLECYNQSLTQMLPYKDETIVTAFTGDGATNEFVLDFVPNSVNEFEVYVGGVRQRKNDLMKFDHSLAQDSPEGDVLHPAEFSIDGSKLTLLHTPPDKVLIHVIRRLGKLWTKDGESLAHSDTSIAKMIRSVQVDIPR